MKLPTTREELERSAAAADRKAERPDPRSAAQIIQATFGDRGVSLPSMDVIEAAICRKSLKQFVKRAWSIVEGDKEFKDNWHIDLICAELEKLTAAQCAGETRNLLINIPPGAMKSIICGVMWPAWVWTFAPEKRFMTASYGADLSTRDAVNTRMVVESEWYQRLWGSHVKLDSAQNQKTYYQNTRGGWRMATSVGGRATGIHPDFKLVDDPHTVKEAVSDADRQTGLDWFDQTLTMRGATRHAATVVVMQRIHESDLSGHIIESSGFKDTWTHVCLPMRYEIKHPNVDPRDPRRTEGELLWPSLYTEQIVAVISVPLGEYGVAGQLQQRPSPVGGGILKMTKYVQLWPAAQPIPDFLYVVQSYDTAFTEKEANDPTACSVWAVFEHKKKRNVLIIDAWTEHLEYPELRTQVMRDWKAEYGGRKDVNGFPDVLHPGKRPNVVLVEKKASGQSLLQDLNRARVPIHAYDPLSKDKVQRAHEVAPLLETGCVWVLESRKPSMTDQPIQWVKPLIKECEQFPAGKHDDLVDTTTQALIYLRDTGWLELPKLEEDEETEHDYHADKNKRRNPYGSARA